MKNTFTSKYKDKNDGAKIKTLVTVESVDLTKDLGHDFIFIQVESKDPDRNVIEQISVPQKDVKKLIKLLKKFKNK